MVTCRERSSARAVSLRSFAESDWGAAPIVLRNDSKHPLPIVRIRDGWKLALQFASTSSANVVLLMEDDILINRHVLHNVQAWQPLHEMMDGLFFGSLYNPGVPPIRVDEHGRHFVARHELTWGAQALLVSPRMARIILEHWSLEQGHADRAMTRIACRMVPFFYHVPSLVEHQRAPSTWRGLRHCAKDFSTDWKAPDTP